MSDPSPPRPTSAFRDFWRRRFSRMVPLFYANGITVAGSMLTLVALVLLLGALGLEFYRSVGKRAANPYEDLVIFMVLPGLLLIGLALVVVGLLVRRVKERRSGLARVEVEIGGSEFWRRTALIAGVTLVGLLVLGTFSYEAYHFTDSTEFCTDVCHEVMEPEGVAYRGSPHAHVSCVSCHIGPGASWFVRSKLSGVRQVFAVLGGNFSRPIPTPVHNLRPARETCEICHWPTKFHGSKLVVKEHFETDRDNTATVSALVMKIGGLDPAGRPTSGIHWHVDPANEVRYRALDEDRQQIVEVIQKTPAGEIRYLAEDTDPDDISGQWRVMDCIDCHNRPTHIFERPDVAVDRAFAGGKLRADIPYLREAAERVLLETQPDDSSAVRIAAGLQDLYRQEHPEQLADLRPHLQEAAAVLAEILERNVFPRMNVVWGTYPSNLSHFDAEGEFTTTGCFRCHDEEHVAADGRTISQDCDNCHVLIAEREADRTSLPDFVAEFFPRP